MGVGREQGPKKITKVVGDGHGRKGKKKPNSGAVSEEGTNKFCLVT